MAARRASPKSTKAAKIETLNPAAAAFTAVAGIKIDSVSLATTQEAVSDQ
jgi:hypothetical protein